MRCNTLKTGLNSPVQSGHGIKIALFAVFHKTNSAQLIYFLLNSISQARSDYRGAGGV